MTQLELFPNHYKHTDTELAVVTDILERQKKGLAKYGVSVADNTLTEAQWLQHLYEEILDAAIYLKRLQQERAK